MGNRRTGARWQNNSLGHGRTLHAGGWSSLADGTAEVGDCRNPPEEFLDVVQGCLPDERRSGMVRCVFQNNREILQMERVTQRRLDADIRGDASEHKVADTS